MGAIGRTTSELSPFRKLAVVKILFGFWPYGSIFRYDLV